MLNLPEAVTEYRFHPSRRWRFDYAYPAHKVAIEVEGAVWAGGRHTRGAGYLADCEKYNAAQLLGWIVLRYSPAQMETMDYYEDVITALKMRGWKQEEDI